MDTVEIASIGQFHLGIDDLALLSRPVVNLQAEIPVLDHGNG
jgi:hypothetical protein